MQTNAIASDNVVYASATTEGHLKALKVFLGFASAMRSGSGTSTDDAQCALDFEKEFLSRLAEAEARLHPAAAPSAA